MSDFLSPHKRAAIEALAGGAGHGAAAAAAGVSPRTLYRWRRDPAFAAALREADADALGEIARALNAASRSALDVLLAVLEDPTAPPALRVRAAGEILKHRAAFFELLTLSDRVAELERLVTP